MAKRLIIPLIVLLALVAVMAYIGSERVITFDFLPQTPQDENVRYVSMQIAFAALVLFVFAVIAVWSLLVWLWRLPKRLKKGQVVRRRRGGIAALEAALVAIESGNGRKAVKKAAKAADLLEHKNLTTLVAARAAEMSGDHEQAEAYYKALAEHEETARVAQHGLSRLGKQQGKAETVIAQARAAFEAPDSPKWAFDHLFEAQLDVGDWDGALESLEKAEKRKFLDKEEARRRKAVLLAARADALDENGQPGPALEAARQAAALAPDFAPAVALAAHLAARNGETRLAGQLIEKAWARRPHPALAQAFRDLWRGEPAKVQAKKLKSLIRHNPDHKESLILKAEQALDGGDAVTALHVLGPLLQDQDVTDRVCVLAGRAEDMLGNAVDARAWHIRAASAKIDPDWSDLDPDGPAFDYSQDDWRQLVESYGKTGKLTHPRAERGERRRPVAGLDANRLEKAESVKDDIRKEDDASSAMAEQNEVDEAGSAGETDRKNLARRLESLLDKDKKTD